MLLISLLRFISSFAVPLLTFNFHLQQQAKVGLAVSVEAPNEELLDQQEKAATTSAPPPPF